MKLSEANLGRRKIVFPNKNASHDEVKSVLEKECPKLKSGGGYILLRAFGGGAGQRSLQVIQPGEKGYSIPYLCCAVCVGQAVTYVHPLQTHLSVDKVCNQELSGGPSISCLSCGKSITYSDVQKHQGKCPVLNSKEKHETDTISQDVTSNEDGKEILDIKGIKEDSDEDDGKERTVKDLYIGQLKEMFPRESNERIKDALKHGKDNIDHAISYLLGEFHEGDVAEYPVPIIDPDVDPLQSLIETYKRQITNSTPLILNISKSDLWKLALIFYKSHKREDLIKPLHISFDGPFDVGVDAGGPRRDFFGDVLRNVTQMLFEGDDNKRVPQHSWEKANLMKLGGIAFAHSILHGGPTFPVIAPYVFYYILSGSQEIASTYVRQEDLPKTPSNLVLHTMIDELKNSDDDRIVELLQREDYGTVVDRSGWPIQKMLNASAVPEITHYLLVEELVTKRVTALSNLRQGINYFGLVDVSQRVDSSVFQRLLCGDKEVLTADKFLSCFESTAPFEECKLAAYRNLMKFIKENEGEIENIPALGGDVEVLVLLLKFTTANMANPPLGFEKARKIKLEYLPEKSVLPDADACFSILQLPIKHNDNYSDFARCMLTALRHASCTFGEL